MRISVWPFLLVFLCGVSHAGILSETQREELVALVQKNFWGKAKLSNGQIAQAETEMERSTVPIPKAVIARSFDAGEVSGLAEWCNLDWQANYASLTKGARSRGFSDKQVAFISFLHGSAQGRIASAMTKSRACGAQDRTKVEQFLNQSQGRWLAGT